MDWKHAVRTYFGLETCSENLLGLETCSENLLGLEACRENLLGSKIGRNLPGRREGKNQFGVGLKGRTNLE